MPRPKTVDDETILAAVIDVVGRDGPADYTLASVAKEVGLSAASLVQRFGTKRALLLAADKWAVERWVAGMDAPSDDLPALKRLVQGLVHTVDPAATPVELANSVSLLQIGLADPEFHSSTQGGARRIRGKVTDCLCTAREEGELRDDVDIVELADLLEVTYHGALIAWAIHRDGDVATWVTDRLERLLDAYRPASATADRR